MSQTHLKIVKTGITADFCGRGGRAWRKHRNNARMSPRGAPRNQSDCIMKPQGSKETPQWPPNASKSIPPAPARQQMNTETQSLNINCCFCGQCCHCFCCCLATSKYDTFLFFFALLLLLSLLFFFFPLLLLFWSSLFLWLLFLLLFFLT